MEKSKLFLASFVRKSCALTLEKEVEITELLNPSGRAFWEVNSLLSYLHKYCHYLSQLDPTLITSGPHFSPYVKRESPGELESLRTEMMTLTPFC